MTDFQKYLERTALTTTNPMDLMLVGLSESLDEAREAASGEFQKDLYEFLWVIGQSEETRELTEEELNRFSAAVFFMSLYKQNENDSDRVSEIAFNMMCEELRGRGTACQRFIDSGLLPDDETTQHNLEIHQRALDHMQLTAPLPQSIVDMVLSMETN